MRINSTDAIKRMAELKNKYSKSKYGDTVVDFYNMAIEDCCGVIREMECEKNAKK